MFFIVIDKKIEFEKIIKLNCLDITKKKLEANSMSGNLDGLEKKIIIKENLNDFNTINIFIPILFEILWENPKLVSDIILFCNLSDIKEHLAIFFMNNFYENILSGNSIENNLMYVLTLLIKNEINKIENIEDCDKFLDKDSKVAYLLSEIRKKAEVKYYFKTFILNLISDLESMSSVYFSLNFNEMLNILKRKTNNLDNKTSLNNYFLEQTKSKILRDKKELDELKAKTLATLTIKDIKNMTSKSNSRNPDMEAYINNYIDNSKNGELSYSNLRLMEKFDSKIGLSDNLIFIYINKFCLIKDFLDKFLLILERNISLLPYSIKCFCKIINILIQKKFPEINISQKNAFISQFFFKTIIKPILSGPDMELLINNFIISGYTLPNLNIINEILDKLFSGKLFENNDELHNNYTPFNWYFLEKIQNIIEIFKKLEEVELPPFIDDLVNNKLDSNFVYNYSQLNNEDKIIHSSICFTINDLKAILYGLSQLKDKVDISKYKGGKSLYKTVEKLNSEKQRKILEDMENKNNDNFCVFKRKGSISKKRASFIKDKGKENESIIRRGVVEIENDKYYLIQKLIINDEYKEFFENKLSSKNNFNLKESKDTTNNPEEKQKNSIIKIKNFLSDFLYNIIPLNKFNLPKSNINNTKDILNSIKNYSKLPNYILDNSIPLAWYIESILNLIKNLSEDYSKNDFEKLYDELEKEIKSSINGYDIDFLLEFINRLKYIDKEKLYFEQFFKDLKDLELNQKVKDIVENDFIPVKISFNYEDQNKNFSIEKLKIKEEALLKKELKEISDNSPIHKSYCRTILSFIEKFPDFSVFQEKQDIDILELQKNLSLPKKLKEYFFSIIREYLTKEYNKENELDLIQIENKIYDYVMSKINSKIFPKTYDDDDKIFKNLFMLSWTEPKHFIQGKNNYIFDAFLPQVIDNFNSLDNAKSPRIKIIMIGKIFELISKIVFFNGGNTNLGVDDQMPILNYCIVKAQPNRICSNIKFIELYRNSLIEKGNDNELAQMIALCDYIKNIKYNNLIGISQEEFTSNCNSLINAG